MTISSKFLTVVAIIGGTVLAGLTSGFTTAKDQDPTYFFEYQSGTVSNPSSWSYTLDGTGCDGQDKSCKIEVNADYVDEATSPVSIDSLALPNGQLPTITSPTNDEVPGGDPDIYAHIFNKDE